MLVAPVVLRGQGGGTPSTCTPRLRFRRQLYLRHAVPASATTQGAAIGVGVIGGCGRTPANVNVRSLVGIPAARAVAIESDTDLYVRERLCRGVPAAQLVGCLKA